MKERNRLFAILLSIVMVVSYMPAFAFAGTEDAAPSEAQAAEEAQETQPEAPTEETEPAAEEPTDAPEPATEGVKPAGEAETTALVDADTEEPGLVKSEPEETGTSAKNIAAPEDITSMEFISHDGNPVVLTEGVNGYYQSLEDEHFVYSLFSGGPMLPAGDKIKVTYADGSEASYSCLYSSIFENDQDESDQFDLGAEFSITDDQSDSQWKPGETHEFVLTYNANNAISFSIPVTTMGNAIDSIQYIGSEHAGTQDDPIELMEGVDSNFYENVGEGFEYYYYYWKKGDRLVINYAGGETKAYTFDDNNYGFIDGEGARLDGGTSSLSFYNADQWTNHWYPGNVYEASISYSGRTATLYFRIIENPVASIEYTSFDGRGSEDKPIKLIEGVDGSYNRDSQGNRYFQYWPQLKDGDVLTINYSDSSKESETYSFDRGRGTFVDENGASLDGGNWSFSYQDQWTTHWETGSVYRNTFSCFGRRTNVYYKPVKNPVKEVSFSRDGGVVLTEGQDAVNSDGGSEEFFSYYRLEFQAGDTLEIKLQDDESEETVTETYQAESYTDDEGEQYIRFANTNGSGTYIYDYELKINSDPQSFEEEWKADDGLEHWFTVTYRKVESGHIPVSFRANPVRSFSFSRAGGVKLYEGVDGVNSDGADGSFFEYFFDFKPGDKLNVTAADDNIYTYEAVRDSSSGDIEFRKKSGGSLKDVITTNDIDWYPDSDQYDVHWYPDDGVNHYYTLLYSGKSYKVDVSLEENPDDPDDPAVAGEPTLKDGTLWLGCEYMGDGDFEGDLDGAKLISVTSSNTGIVKAEMDEGASYIFDFILEPLKLGQSTITVKYSLNGETKTTSAVYTVKPFPVFTSLAVDGASIDVDKYKNYYHQYKYAGTAPVFKYAAAAGWKITDGYYYLDNGNEDYDDDPLYYLTEEDIRDLETGLAVQFPKDYAAVRLFAYFENTSGETIMHSAQLEREEDPYGPDEPHEHTLVKVEASPATCAEDGNSAYWYCSECGAFFSDANGEDEIEEGSWLIPATGEHSWGDAVYTTNADKTKMTASHICSVCGAEESETVGVSVEFDKPTFDAAGRRTYTSGRFENPAFTVQSWTEDVAQLVREWNEPTYRWSADYTKVTATRTCVNDPDHAAITETVEATSETTKEATADEEGVVTWTSAEFTADDSFTVQTTTQKVPKVVSVEEGREKAWGDLETADEAVAKAEQSSGEALGLAENLDNDSDPAVIEAAAAKLNDALADAQAAMEAAQAAYEAAQAYYNAAQKALDDLNQVTPQGRRMMKSSAPMLKSAEPALGAVNEVPDTPEGRLQDAKEKVAAAKYNNAAARNTLARSQKAASAIAMIQANQAIAEADALAGDPDASEAEKAAAADKANNAAANAVEIARESEKTAAETESLVAYANDDENIEESRQAAMAGLVSETETITANATGTRIEAEKLHLTAAEAAAVAEANSAAATAKLLADAAASAAAIAEEALSGYEEAAKQAKTLSEKAASTKSDADVANAQSAVNTAAAKKKTAEEAIAAAKNAAKTAEDAIAEAREKIDAADSLADMSEAKAKVTEADDTTGDSSDSVATTEEAKAEADKDYNIAKTTTDNAAKANADAKAAAEQAAAQAAAAAAAQPAEIIDLPVVKISKPKAAKKKLTVKWKKVSKKNLKKIKGIQIQIATDPGFTNIVKTANVGKKKTSKKFSGLQKKTKYYVRIRAYGEPNHFSGWKTKTGKTK